MFTVHPLPKPRDETLGALKRKETDRRPYLRKQISICLHNSCIHHTLHTYIIDYIHYILYITYVDMSYIYISYNVSIHININYIIYYNVSIYNHVSYIYTHTIHIYCPSHSSCSVQLASAHLLSSVALMTSVTTSIHPILRSLYYVYIYMMYINICIHILSIYPSI
jgi:hypothetical protein